MTHGYCPLDSDSESDLSEGSDTEDDESEDEDHDEDNNFEPNTRYKLQQGKRRVWTIYKKTSLIDITY